MTKQFMLDVASYQENLTVQQIKQSGAKAVVIKLTESTNYTNPYIAKQIDVCKQAGIQYIHFYHFQRATTVSGLTAEANYCVNVAKKYGYKVETLTECLATYKTMHKKDRNQKNFLYDFLKNNRR